MAVPTGSGTETLHSHLFQDVDNYSSSRQTLIFGVQHHVYTVLSVIVYCNALDATTDFGFLLLNAYDIHGGAASQDIQIARFNIQVGETYVWNDKFSFNGAEPANYTGPMNSAADQDLIADQGSTPVANLLNIGGEHGSDDFDVHCTYLDQNNA